jgi:hypothetical protein
MKKSLPRDSENSAETRKSARKHAEEPPLSLYPLDFETALKGALDAGPYPPRTKSKGRSAQKS